MKLQFALAVFQQVENFFVIQLQHRALDNKVLLVRRVNDLKDVLKGSGNYSALLVFRSTLHGKCLPCSCLSVGKDSPVVPLENTLHYSVGAILVYVLLSRLVVINVIKGKLLGLVFGLVLYKDGLKRAIGFDHILISLLHLLVTKRPASDSHSDSLLHKYKFSFSFKKFS